MQAKAYARSRWYTAAFALRQRMLNFVQNFEYYMMFEVIEPNWHDFQQNMAKVSFGCIAEVEVVKPFLLGLVIILFSLMSIYEVMIYCGLIK